MQWLGLDVGGANLKLADGRGWAVSRPFPLWRQPAGLVDAVAELLASAPAADGLAVTMTGELADCFATKREGVEAILRAVEAAAARALPGRELRVYLTGGELAPLAAAREQPLRVAASNWHALARFAGRLAPRGAALLIDIGSTTTDLIPLLDGAPAVQGWTDPERLLAGELVYTGVERSPVCALVSALPWGGAMCPVAQEVFATTGDAYLVLGDLPEEPENTSTADGRPATAASARDRLARMICADRELFTAADALAAARHIAGAQLDLVARAAEQVFARSAAPIGQVILSGAGEFLGRRLAARVTAGKVAVSVREMTAHGVCLLQASVISLADRLGRGPSLCAPAHALAVLANEEARP